MTAVSKIVVYAGTRNVYKQMTTAAKSLLCHTHVDRVWFLIEDDAFPEPLPNKIGVMNVSGQKWFDPDGVNAKKRWGWMSMMRLALPALFPGYDRVLWLDIDTIVNKDIGELFTMDLEGCYVGAVEEPMRSKRPFQYFNAGVMIMDLNKLRGEMTKRLISRANSTPMDFPDQDVINILCQGYIKEISPYYNSNVWIVEVDDPAIQHFAADRNYTERPLWKEYERMDWRVL